MSRPVSELRPEVRLAIVSTALGGADLSEWWAPNWSPARARIVSGHGGWASSEWSGEKKPDGVHVWFGRRYTGPPASVHEKDFESRIRKPDVLMTWADVHEVVAAGATQDRRQRYLKAHQAHIDHNQQKPPVPIPRRGQLPPGAPEPEPDPRNEAFWEEGKRRYQEFSEAGADILRAGVEALVEKELAAPVQGLLW